MTELYSLGLLVATSPTAPSVPRFSACEWRLCQPALPGALRWVTRCVLRTSSETLFATALAAGALERAALAALDGAHTCFDDDGALVPGGAVLCLVAPPPAEEQAGGADAPPLACVAAVVMPGAGGLVVYAPKEERLGMLALVDGGRAAEDGG